MDTNDCQSTLVHVFFSGERITLYYCCSDGFFSPDGTNLHFTY